MRLDNLDKLFQSNRIILFLHGTAHEPKTEPSKNAVRFLNAYGIDYFPVDITSNHFLRSQIQALSGWLKFPQLFVNKEFIGGSYIIPEFIVSGELNRIIDNPFRDHISEASMKNPIMQSHHNDAIWSIKVSASGSFIVTGSADKTVRIWDVQSKDERRILRGHSGWVNCIDISPDLNFVVSGSTDTTVRVWLVKEGVESQILRGHRRWVNGVAITPDGERVVSVSADRTIRVWDISNGMEVKKANGHDECIWSVCVTPDGKHAVTSSADRKVIIWDLDTLKREIIISGHKNIVTSVTTKGSEERFLSVSYDSSMMEWDYQGRQINIYSGHEKRIWSVATTSDAKLLATVGADKKAILWQSNERVEFLQQDMPTSCALSPDGKLFVIGLKSGKLIWISLSQLKMNGSDCQ